MWHMQAILEVVNELELAMLELSVGGGASG